MAIVNLDYRYSSQEGWEVKLHAFEAALADSSEGCRVIPSEQCLF